MGFEQYPEYRQRFEELCRTRRDEILQDMVDGDCKYNELRHARANLSMRLREALGDNYNYLEEYTDAVYEQECYELDALYRHGILDALTVIMERG